ncbi:MAG: DUF86 domain-containing protein [Cyanobacteria bacterium J06634_6]
MSPRDLQSLLDMLQSAEVVLAYLEGMTKDQFYDDEEKQDAVMRRMMVVGEAANRVSEETRLSLTSIRWPKVRGMRNRLVHEYDDIDLAIVWQTAQTILPELITKLQDAIPSD